MSDKGSGLKLTAAATICLAANLGRDLERVEARVTARARSRSGRLCGRAERRLMAPSNLRGFA